MAIYKNISPQAQVKTVEHTQVGDRSFLFVELAPTADKDAMRALLQSSEMGQQIVSETPTSRDCTLIVCQGDNRCNALLEILREHGELLFEPPAKEQGFNPWLWRGITSIAGQSMQITSGFLGKGTKADRYSLIGFGVLNLMANFVNIVFGAQQKHDTHQLRLLKQQVNASLGSAIPKQDLLPSIDENPLDSREKPDETFGTQTYKFLQKYSVSAGEIGLRTVAATQLSFPLLHCFKAAKIFRSSGSYSKAFAAAKNDNPVTYSAGLLTLLGKFVSMTAKEPDPYNPDPPRNDAVNQFRTKFAFPLSSLLEGAGAAYMTHDRFTKQEITFGGKTMPDWVGGTGNAIFVGGYGIRMAAPYGTREVDMKQLYAHASDALTKIQPEERPAALAQIATQLKRHFHDKDFNLSDIYSKIATDMQTNHDIIIDTPKGMPAKPEVPSSEEHAPQHVAALSKVHDPVYEQTVETVNQTQLH